MAQIREMLATVAVLEDEAQAQTVAAAVKATYTSARAELVKIFPAEEARSIAARIAIGMKTRIDL
jgi:hypothetical protein